MKNVIFCMLAALLLLCGCTPRDNTGTLRSLVAEKASVICENCPDGMTRSYVRDESIGRLFLYFRSLGSLSSVKGQPSPADPRQATIIFTMADGSKRIYRQLGNDYLRIGYGPWQQLPKGKGIHLWQLLADTPSDSDK